MRRRVLVISPHPDDESIGCGGTVRKHVTDGDEVHVVFLTSGEKGGHGRAEARTLALREREGAAAQQILGVRHIEFYREPDAALRVRPAAVKRLADKLRGWQPHVVYVPHDREMHADHRAAVRLLRAAMKGAAPNGAASNGATRPPLVLMYEVWTPLQ